MSDERTSSMVLVYAAKQVALDELEELVRRTTWAYGENEMQTVLTFSKALALSDYPVGRAFSASYEVRWNGRQSEFYSVQVLVDAPWHDERFTQVREFAERGPDYSLLLWGEYVGRDGEDNGIWAETRIPKPLFYPVEGQSGYAYLQVCDLYENGQVATTRWLGVTGSQT